MGRHRGGGGRAGGPAPPQAGRRARRHRRTGACPRLTRCPAIPERSMGKRLMAALFMPDPLYALRATLAETASPRLRQAASERAGRFPERGWTVSADGFSAHARPARLRPEGQGWKIHVSAVPDVAEVTLARCDEILLPPGVPFKFAQDLAVVIMLVSPRSGRSGGKFLTAYPPTPARAGHVSARLAAPA